IFDAGNKVGLHAASDLGGGHVHIDAVRAFGNDVGLFRNFVVDFVNRPELSMRTLAPRAHPEQLAVAELPIEMRRNFENVISKFDKDMAAGKPWTVKRLATEIDKEVYGAAEKADIARNRRVFAANMDRLIESGPKTLAIRGVTDHPNAEGFAR